MSAPPAERILDVWDRTLRLNPARRCDALVRLADHAAPESGLDELSVGTRDAILLRLRSELFGDALAAEFRCTACGEMLELDLRVSDLTAVACADVTPRSEDADGYVLDFRVPTVRDIDAVANAGSADSAEAALLRRCVTVRDRSGERIDPVALPSAIRDLIDDRLSSADSQACIVLVVRCVACGSKGEPTLDIGTLLWDEIDDWARRALEDVHVIARAYGWREREILAMSQQRRDLYVAMIER